MILKSADDKSKRLALLEDLQSSPLLDFNQKKWLREELMRTQKGIQGERDAAHYLDNYFKGAENHVVMHDLRVIVDGDVAQIDHLVLARGNAIYLIETKNYSGNLVINEHGEFTVSYGDVRFGIPSPMEQSRRHERILMRLFERLEIVGRTQKQLDFRHLVLLHPKAVIERPSSKLLDTTNVIKADQFPTWHEQFVEKLSFGTVMRVVANLRSLETITEWGNKLKRQHRPADLLTLPDFMLPKQHSAPKQTSGGSAATTASAVAVQTLSTQPATQKPQPPAAVATSTTAPARKLICAKCGIKISYPEGKFCWNNEKRFGGLQYCREHQALF